MNNKIFHIILFFLSLSSFSQTLEDSKKKYPIRNINTNNNIVVSTSATPITNANFQDAINTCLATNPVDGMCSDSEYGAMPDWDVSQVNDMSYAFRLKTNFNGDLSAWDVSNVTTMFQMFGLANNFNGNISAWDVSNVTIMQYMFSDATSFNQPLEDWDVSNVTEMRDLFSYSSFNQDISGWCVSNIVSEPSDFSTGSPLIESNKPVWGTCANSSSDYNFCDDDGDGIMTIDLTTILDEVQVAVSGDLQVADPKLLIGTSEDKLLQIDNILLNPITTVLCELPDNTYDVAMNSSLHYYSTNFNSIDFVDDLTCQLSSQLNIGGNSLSFDTQDNLYFNVLGAGTASTSAVYRLNPEPGATPYIWHDFNSGTAGGDFVIFGNFMYIAWKFNEDVLLKVTIDDDINYVSHEVLGPLKFNTFGLASEQGVLYGITEGEIYKINLATSPPSFETILQNDYTHGAWYGSAGFSEAIAFSSSAHISQLDADNNDNTLPNPWVNTVPGEQTIYIRTEEVSEDSNYTVTPVTITISPTPSVATTPPNMETCDFDGNGTELFDLTPQTNLILGTQDSTLFEVIYSTENTFTNLITTPQSYLCTSPLETIFFKIINSSESTCFSEGEFNLTFIDEVNCAQNEPPVLSADSREAYCPLSEIKIAENFTITDPDDTGLDFFTVQISTGYSNPEDILTLTGTHPTISTTWNAIEGKLILEPNAPATQILYVDLQTAVREIVFSSTDPNITGEKFFSLTIGDGNYLPSTEHFYVYEENIGITWSEAKNLAELSSYFGLQGYLATILSVEENQISAEQISGTGWIGASDEGTEGVWNWVTGPEAGTNFWNGTFTGGPAGGLYSNWNTNEPNQSGNEDYAHITDNSVGIPGSWNDLPNAGGGGPYEPKGYIVEYGGMPGDPLLNISASTSIYIPEITGTTNDNTCTGGSVSLSATVTEGEIYWYDALVGGNLLFTGDTFSIPLLNSSTTYYVAASPEGCATTERIAVEAIVDTTPVLIPSPLDINRCDEDRVGFVDFDLIADQTPEILNSLDPILNPDLTDFEVLYFDNLLDADANTTAAIIANPYPVNTSDNPTIYARVHNINSNTCYTIVEFKLKVTDTPTPSQPTEYRLCDDTTSAGGDTDGVSSFLLNTKDAEILASVTNPAEYTLSYHTNLLDAQTSSTSNAIDKNTDFEVTNSQRIYVRIENIDNVACNTISDDSPGSTFTSFELIVDPLPIITDVVALKLCDEDQDGFTSFDLTLANALISLNSANETFQYYPSELDAANDTSEITNFTDYTNVVNTNDIIWVRTTSIDACFRISQVNLEVTNTEIPVAFQRTFSECDDFLDINGNDTSNNDDTDGVSSFDFSSVSDEIVALFPTSQTINVSYYESLADANIPVNPIFNTSNYRNIASPFTQQIFIRVDNPANVNCAYVGTHITLSVNPVPEIDVIPNLDICDDANDTDDTNGFVQSIDLESHTPIILGTQDPTNFTVTYHVNQSDAISGSSSLSSPFTNTTVDQQTIYVRVINNSTGCLVDRLSFDVVVNPLPSITDVVELKQCDDDTDGFSLFNLNEAATDISTNYLNETFVFYPSLVDAENDTNAFTAAEVLVFENRTETMIVWARAISSENCYRIAQVDIIVSTTGLPAAFQRNFSVCDDFLDIDGNDTANNDDNDGISTFDFSSVTQEVLDLFPTTQQLTVTYYRNLADALAELNAIADPSNYRNIGYPITQQIYIRVDSDLDNDCLGFGPYITLTVEPVTAQEVGALELCDDLDDGDGFNGIVQTFNLESQTPIILGTQDPVDFTVTYHNSAADALSGNAPIATPAMYQNSVPNLETIFVRVENNLSGCFTAQTSFDIIVNPLPVANFVEDLEICDDNTDGSAQNGFSQSFDLELQTAGILGTQDPAQFTVTYHASLADAQAGVLPLGSPFSNSVPFSQIIYARVYNSLTGCANGISNFNAIVNPEPTTENASNLSYCDDDLDGDDTNGFVQNIDLDSQITDILGPLQDPDDFNVTFHETQTDATDGTDALSSPYTNTTANQQTIYVRVENKDTQCVNDDFTFDVIVNPLPEFTVTSPQIVCLSGPDLTIFVENPAAVYDYVWTDPSGNEIIGSQITISSGGLYTVTATTTNGTGCTRTREILVNESSVATITDADVTIVDDSDNNSITIDPTNLGIGDYQYALIDEDGIQTSFQDLPFFENLQGGFYTIVVQDKNGCRPDARLLVSVIEFPKFFTPNNDGINDTWAIKGANSTFFPSAQINIFNRFGKIVAQIDIDTQGWDGTYGGKILASDDYWFSIILVDRNGALRERKGNFSLLRR